MAKKRQNIDPKTIKDWKLKLYETSIVDIQQETNISRPTITNAIRFGAASQEVIEKLTIYFNNIKLPA